MSSRRKSEILRGEICERAEDRFQNVYRDKLREWTAKGQPAVKLEKGWLTLSFSPIFPKEMLRTPPEIRGSLRNLTVPDYYGPSQEFPIFDKVGMQFAQPYTACCDGPQSLVIPMKQSSRSDGCLPFAFQAKEKTTPHQGGLVSFFSTTGASKGLQAIEVSQHTQDKHFRC